MTTITTKTTTTTTTLTTLLTLITILFFATSAQTQTVKMNPSAITLGVQIGVNDYEVEYNSQSPASALSVHVGVQDYEVEYASYRNAREFEMDGSKHFEKAMGSAAAKLIDLDFEFTGSVQVIPDKKTGAFFLATCIGEEGTPPEELDKNLWIDRTADGRMVSNIRLYDFEGLLESQVPGISGPAILSIPLDGSLDGLENNFLLVKGREGRWFALMRMHNGARKVRVDGSGSARLSGTLLKPVDDEKSGEIPVILEF
jgi:hypothetical protein